MGWTWHHSAATLLTRYPQLEKIKPLMESWPQLKLAVENKRSGKLNLKLPNNGLGIPVIEPETLG